MLARIDGAMAKLLDTIEEKRGTMVAGRDSVAEHRENLRVVEERLTDAKAELVASASVLDEHCDRPHTIGQLENP